MIENSHRLCETAVRSTAFFVCEQIVMLFVSNTIYICIFARKFTYRLMTKQKKEAEVLSKIAVEAIRSKKGRQVTLIDFDGVEGSLFEYYVLCTANSPSHVDALADEIEKQVKELTGISPRRVEGLQNCQWVLLDYFDVIIHVFLAETREFYNMEAMWKDVKQIHFEDED